VLKAFESGADLVCAIGCDEDECHYLEGSKRCGHRVEYVRSILRDIGLGGERLLFFRAPGAALRDQVMLALESLPPNPLHRIQTDKEVVNSCLEGDNAED
jgi:coenzyme F420-reducing hydrogenase delta subunit